MTVELRTEDQQLLQMLVDSGQYASIDEALHSSILSLAGGPSEQYKQYLRNAVEEGLAQIAAGQFIDGEEFLAELKAPLGQEAQ